MRFFAFCSSRSLTPSASSFATSSSISRIVASSISMPGWSALMAAYAPWLSDGSGPYGFDPKRRVLDLAPGYVPPVPQTVVATGNEGMGNLQYAAWSMREGGQITYTATTDGTYYLNATSWYQIDPTAPDYQDNGGYTIVQSDSGLK